MNVVDLDEIVYIDMNGDIWYA